MLLTYVILVNLAALRKIITIKTRFTMKQHQGGVKISLIVISVILMGVSAWFNQANADESTRAVVIQQD
jgi:hypothetical protein